MKYGLWLLYWRTASDLGPGTLHVSPQWRKLFSMLKIDSKSWFGCYWCVCDACVYNYMCIDEYSWESWMQMLTSFVLLSHSLPNSLHLWSLTEDGSTLAANKPSDSPVFAHFLYSLPCIGIEVTVMCEAMPRFLMWWLVIWTQVSILMWETLLLTQPHTPFPIPLFIREKRKGKGRKRDRTGFGFGSILILWSQGLGPDRLPGCEEEGVSFPPRAEQFV